MKGDSVGDLEEESYGGHLRRWKNDPRDLLKVTKGLGGRRISREGLRLRPPPTIHCPTVAPEGLQWWVLCPANLWGYGCLHPDFGGAAHAQPRRWATSGSGHSREPPPSQCPAESQEQDPIMTPGCRASCVRFQRFPPRRAESTHVSNTEL